MVIRRIKGDTYPVQVQILSQDGTAFNLSGCTAYFTVKKRYEDSDAEALISVTTTSHDSESEGITSFTLTSGDVDIDGSFIYDVRVKDTNDIVYSIVSDKILFEKPVRNNA